MGAAATATATTRGSTTTRCSAWRACAAARRRSTHNTRDPAAPPRLPSAEVPWARSPAAGRCAGRDGGRGGGRQEGPEGRGGRAAPLPLPRAVAAGGLRQGLPGQPAAGGAPAGPRALLGRSPHEPGVRGAGCVCWADASPTHRSLRRSASCRCCAPWRAPRRGRTRRPRSRSASPHCSRRQSARAPAPSAGAFSTAAPIGWSCPARAAGSSSLLIAARPQGRCRDAR